ncbi:hypothetical protein [Mycolicibacterium stellerae]|uniref:hypothetical protein n=1 Tax=Mycolicibacterium stellerae TaxID=2358193 RepID=UPI000F0B2FBC|nr:hypothetical protein [Mycolicibacterium stellerae]
MAVAAIAATTVGGVTVSPPAARAACQYQFPPIFEIEQNDHWHVTFPVSGDPRRITGPGQAKYWMSGHLDPSFGDPVGGMNENGGIEITVPWSNKSVGKFVGNVRPDGMAEGRSWDETNQRHQFTWMSVEPMPCWSPPAAQEELKNQQQQMQDQMQNEAEVQTAKP